MLQRFVSYSLILTNTFGSHRNKRVLWLSGLVLLFSCMLFLSFGRLTSDRKASSTANTAVPTPATSTTIPTKWWIKTPTAFLPTVATIVQTNLENDCPPTLSSPLRPGMYAYISLVPPLPNRVRADAGKVTRYLGQIQPGAGVKIIDGPLCADGFSWWLVETVESNVRGWTVAGINSEQWVLPCPNPAVACIMSPVIQQATPTAAHSSTQGNNDHTCTSNGISIGMPTQVKEDNLLVVRSEPYIGSVIGHAGPSSAVMIVDGPACAGGAAWWEVNVPSLNLTGWATETNLRPCTKEDDCT